jgi:hypothetical protein
MLQRYSCIETIALDPVVYIRAQADRPPRLNAGSAHVFPMAAPTKGYDMPADAQAFGGDPKATGINALKAESSGERS